MLKNQCISVTDLRTKTKACLENIEKQPKYIFINNKPVAVLIDIEQFENKIAENLLHEMDLSEVSPSLKQEAEKARKAKKKDLINI